MGTAVVVVEKEVQRKAVFVVGVDAISGKAAATFEEALNAFEFYNLRGKETGRYTAFYIPIREVDRFTREAPTAATLGTVTQYDYRYIGG